MEHLRTRKKLYARLSALAGTVVLGLFWGFTFFGPNSHGSIHSGSGLLELMSNGYFLVVFPALSAGPAVVWGMYRDRHTHSG